MSGAHWSVVALDLSLTSTGVAILNSDGTAVTWTLRSTGKSADSLAQRASRIAGIANTVVPIPNDDDEVIIESPAHGAPGGSTWDRAGLWWAVVMGLAERRIVTHHVAPTTVKKWIAGSGRAEKNTVGVHIGRLFPDVEIKSDDEADALAMAHIAAVRAGFDVPRRAGHTPVGYAAVKWAMPTRNHEAGSNPPASPPAHAAMQHVKTDVGALRDTGPDPSTTGTN